MFMFRNGSSNFQNWHIRVIIVKIIITERQIVFFGGVSSSSILFFFSSVDMCFALSSLLSALNHTG